MGHPSLSVASTKKMVGVLIGERKQLRVHCDSTTAISNMAMREDDRFVDLSLSRLRYRIGASAGTPNSKKSDSSRNIVVCARAGCPFRVYAVPSGNKSTSPWPPLWTNATVSVNYRCSYQAAHKAKKRSSVTTFNSKGISSGYFPPTSMLSVHPIRKHSYTFNEESSGYPTI